jgi:hypothetical protein
MIAGGASGSILNSAELYDPTATIAIPRIVSASVQGKKLFVFAVPKYEGQAWKRPGNTVESSGREAHLGRPSQPPSSETLGDKQKCSSLSVGQRACRP